MTEIELGPSSLRSIVAAIIAGTSSRFYPTTTDWAFGEIEATDALLAELARTANPEAPDYPGVERFEFRVLPNGNFDATERAHEWLENQIADLRAERDKLAEENASLNFLDEQVAEEYREWKARSERAEARLVAIDAAAAKLPEMPEMNGFSSERGYDNAIEAYATLMRDTASSLQVENENLKVSVRNLKGAMAADDNRLEAAGKRIGMDYTGCDTPDDMAEEILSLRAEREAALAEAEGLRRDMETMQAYSYRAGLNDKTGGKLAEIEAEARRQGAEEEMERIIALLDGGDLCLVFTNPNDCGGSHLTGSSLREAMAPTEKEK